MMRRLVFILLRKEGRALFDDLRQGLFKGALYSTFLVIVAQEEVAGVVLNE